MRSMALIGIWFRSTVPPFRPCAATRRPLSRISVALEPWPRRLAEVAPLLPRCAPPTTSALLARLSRPLPLADSIMMTCSALVTPSRSMSPRVMIWTGSAPSVAMRLMLEPVMVTRCSPVCARAWVAMPSSARLPTRIFSFIKTAPRVGRARDRGLREGKVLQRNITRPIREYQRSPADGPSPQAVHGGGATHLRPSGRCTRRWAAPALGRRPVESKDRAVPVCPGIAVAARFSVGGGGP